MLNVLALDLEKKRNGFELQLRVTIAPGFSALFGPSGSGKTTTLHLIAGLLKPDRGEIRLNERLLYSAQKGLHVPPNRRRIGYIFQESRLFPHMTVEQNLRYGYRRVHGGERRFAFDEVIEMAGVRPLLSRRPDDLSGGEKQRVALARAVLASPEYLLMDEPLAALDQPARLAFLRFLKKIHGQWQLPILYVTHDLSSVLNFAEEMVMIEAGRLVGQGPPYALLPQISAPPLTAHEDIANVLDVQVVAHEPAKGITRVAVDDLHFVLPLLKVREGESVSLNIPASEIILAREEPRGLSASNILTGDIVALHTVGERVLVNVDAGARFAVEIVPATVERLGLRVGQRVFLVIKASSFRRLA